MFGRMYQVIKKRSLHVQKLHVWLAGRIDRIVSETIREAIDELGAFALKLSDKLLQYIFSIGFTFLFYGIAFYSTYTVWAGYKDTYIGSSFVLSGQKTAILTETFFRTTDLVEIGLDTIFCAIVLLIVLTLTRMFYLNRYLYENRPVILTHLIWGVPLAKAISILQKGAPYDFTMAVDSHFLQVLLPTLIVIHPTMQLVNWLIPEIDEFYRGPVQKVRRIRVEQKFRKAQDKSLNDEGHQ